MKKSTYAVLGFYFNSLIDKGELINLQEVHEKIENKSLLNWLKNKYQDNFDISFLSKDDLNEIELIFIDMSISIKDRRHLYVEKNGLCLLVAYCLNILKMSDKEFLERIS